MRKPLFVASLVATVFATLAGIADAQTLAAAVLPSSRAVQVGATATAFATILNAGAQTATGCAVALPAGIPVDFAFQTTDPTTNAPTGTINTPASIGAGGSQTFVFSMKPTAAFNETNIALLFRCASGQSALSIDGVNTFRLTAATTPISDIVALSATLANDGVVRTPGTRGTGVFSVATVNVGVSGSIVASVDSGLAQSPASFFICQTNPTTGACLQPPAASVATQINGQATPTFGIFAAGLGSTIPFDPAGTRVFVRFRNAQGVTVGSTSVALQTQLDLSVLGGTLTFAAATIRLPAGAARDVVTFDVSSASAPAPVPPGVVPVGNAINVTLNDETRLNAPVILTIDYPPGTDPQNLLVFHVNGTTGQPEPVTILSNDPQARQLTFESRVFSPVQKGDASGVTLPQTFSVPGWSTATNGWSIKNFGNYLSSGGNCFGMAAYAVWYFGSGSTPPLSGAFSTAGGAPVSPAHLLATRAQLAQNKKWNGKAFDSQQQLGGAQIADKIRKTLFITKQPLAFILGNIFQEDPTLIYSTDHAVVVYGWDPQGFLIYDVNFPGELKHADFDGTTFSYSGYSRFGYAAQPSLGRTEDFAKLTQEARAGFVTTTNLSVTTPRQAEEVTTRTLTVKGSYTSQLASDQLQLILYVNGQQQIVPAASRSGTTFEVEIPLKAGDNTLVVLAGVDLLDQSDFKPNSATLVRTIKANITPATLRATLSWTIDNSDLDLYVTDPQGHTAWYGGRGSPDGLILDFDNTHGFGPENTTLSPPAVTLPGDYVVDVHYYRGGSGTVTPNVHGTVTIVLNEGAPTPTVQSCEFTLKVAKSGNAQPGSSGPDWARIANVNVANNTIQRGPGCSSGGEE